jgi:hypothetical protein
MPAPRRWKIVGLDTLAVALLLLTAAIFRTGGFVFYIAGVRVSIGSTHRTLLALLIVLAFRFTIAPRVGPFGRWTTRWQRLLDSTQPEPVVAARAPGACRRGALAALGIAVALAVLLHDQLLHLDWVPDLGDPLFSIWRVGWVAHQIVRDPLHLFDANIFYPERLTLTLSDPVILPALTVAPLLALGIHPAVAYNVLLLSGFWFSGIATYVLVERLTGSARAAFVAGLCYACFAFRFDHYSHLELQMTEWMPLALLALHLFVSTGRWPYALALALAGVAQLYSSMYYAVFFLIYATAIAVGLCIVHRPAMRSVLRPFVICAVVAALLAWPLARAFRAAEPMKGARGLYEVEFYSAYPSDYLRANRYSALWTGRLPPPLPERTLFPGAAPLALAALAVAPPLGTMRLIYLAGLLVSVDGSFGLHGVAYPFYYQLLGPFRGLRSPARFGAVIALTLSILAGFGAARALRRRQSQMYQQTVFAALIALVMIDAWPALTLQPVWREPPPIYEPLRYAPNAVIVEMPIPENEIGNTPFMYFSLWHWKWMVNGYSGFIPKSYADFKKAMLAFPDAAGIDALRRRGVTFVSVNCGLNPPPCEELAERMRQSKALRLTADTTWMNHTVQLYEVVGP